MSKMSLDTFIKEIFNASYSSHPRKVCFFLGAGASKTSGIPSGQDLIRQWDAHLLEANRDSHLRWRAQKGITDENMVGFYSEYYDRRYHDFPTDGYADIERITAAGQPNAGYLMLAQMLTRSPHNVVITTNFDHLTEDAVDRFTDKMPLVIGHENLAEFVTGQPSRPTVIKIHRDLLLEPKSATTALLALSEKWKPALDKIFSNYHPVFLGYAGNDKSVMDYLMANAERFKGEWKKPYWLFYGNEVNSPVVRQFLKKSEGIRIFGCGFDEVMVRMGRKFGYELPDLGKIQEREMEAFGEIRAIYLEFVRKLYQHLLSDAQVSFEKQEWENSARKCQEYLQLVPEDSSVRTQLASCLHLLGNKSGAEAEYRRAIQLNPNNFTYQYLLAKFLYGSGHSIEAVPEYRKAIQINPNHAHAHNEFGNILFDLNRYEEAEQEYQKAIDLDSSNSSYYFSLAFLLAKQGHKERAEKLLDKADSLRKLKIE